MSLSLPFSPNQNCQQPWLAALPLRSASPPVVRLHHPPIARSIQAQGASKNEEPFVPVRRVAYRRSAALPAAVTAEAYEPFQLWDGCRCCAASNASNCVDTSCCYAIDCNIPGKPFGVCAFTPRACGCGANNCTQQPS